MVATSWGMASGTNGSTRVRHQKDNKHSRSKLAFHEGSGPFGGEMGLGSV